MMRWRAAMSSFRHSGLAYRLETVLAGWVRKARAEHWQIHRTAIFLKPLCHSSPLTLRRSFNHFRYHPCLFQAFSA
ncbi:hypothetical protein RHECNPAF_3500027 [Rhizobium etli CNPAF512]|nr:hypothetical protein RHECNPAF_3500027 [Rhizobium etli CNPAF512]